MKTISIKKLDFTLLYNGRVGLEVEFGEGKLMTIDNLYKVIKDIHKKGVLLFSGQFDDFTDRLILFFKQYYKVYVFGNGKECKEYFDIADKTIFYAKKLEDLEYIKYGSAVITYLHNRNYNEILKECRELNKDLYVYISRSGKNYSKKDIKEFITKVRNEPNIIGVFESRLFN